MIDASATLTNFTSMSNASKRKNPILMATGPMGLKIKGTSGARVSSNMRISPLLKFKDIVPSMVSGKQAQKKTSAKNHKTMPLGKSRVGDQHMSDFVMRTTSSLSPEPSSQVKPRMIKMPAVFNPECLMMSRSSKSILSRVKANLGKLCETDQI